MKRRAAQIEAGKHRQREIYRIHTAITNGRALLLSLYEWSVNPAGLQPNSKQYNNQLLQMNAEETAANRAQARLKIQLEVCNPLYRDFLQQLTVFLAECSPKEGRGPYQADSSSA